jgi:hypothetical protein
VRLSHVTALLSLHLLLGCTSDKDEAEPAEDTAAWWEQDVEDSADEDTGKEKLDDGDGKPDDTGDKPDYEDIEDCPDDFDPTEPCEGDWKTTMCTQDGLLWWCEDGAWMNEDDKPDR